MTEDEPDSYWGLKGMLYSRGKFISKSWVAFVFQTIQQVSIISIESRREIILILEKVDYQISMRARTTYFDIFYFMLYI